MIFPVTLILLSFFQDIYVIDERFHYYLRTWLNCMLDVLGTILVIVFATPLFIVAIVPLGFLYLLIQVSVYMSPCELSIYLFIYVFIFLQKFKITCRVSTDQIHSASLWTP